MVKNINEYIVSPVTTIKAALKQMDKGSTKVLFVCGFNNKLEGAISDGDIRRAILKEIPLKKNVSEIMNKKPVSINEKNYSHEIVKEIFYKKRFDAIPIVNDENEVIEVVFWNETIKDSERKVKKINAPLVIMAGGQGTRMAPFTNILPKPLIPIGKKSMLEIIMDEYAKFGIDEFHVTINYKAGMIKAYFEDKLDTYKITYVEEDEYLGTAGALKLLNDKFDKPFFVSNCDIIIKDEYDKIYDFHLNGNYDLTVVASMQHYRIPYGICNLDVQGKLKAIDEKPEIDMLVNTGMYVVNPNVLKFIPNNKLYHITQLITDLMSENYSVGVYPVSEKAWIDVGQWDEYKKSLGILSKISL